MPMLDPENRDCSPVAQLDVPVHFEHHFYFRGGRGIAAISHSFTYFLLLFPQIANGTLI